MDCKNSYDDAENSSSVLKVWRDKVSWTEGKSFLHVALSSTTVSGDSFKGEMQLMKYL